ncbi:MAG: HAD-IIIA family hydrolase [Cyclobacteriaceae bacterium]|jgi:3-deoxy-D-manno-octulosonate 8-phosphate phosphatase (KDO 8-P phosphatase)|nr:HAD-IIIA family hydrolase [Cyclobacteriaceae bacterium]
MPVKEVLGKYTKEQIKKAAGIKALFFDVDGVLTDGKIIYDDAGRELKQFNVKDGYIISHLKKAGLVVGIITGRESAVVSRRATELKLDFCHQGIVDKYSVFEKLIDFHKLKKKEVAYVGDDINDLKILTHCGLAACPADALEYVRTRVDVVSALKGGRGVVREVADLILAARGELDELIEFN